MHQTNDLSRRQFLAASAAGVAGGAAARRKAEDDKALIAITLDLEMSRNFPSREDMHWDYEKGNLNAETKAYTVEACRRVKEGRRSDPLLRGGPGIRAGERGLAQGDRAGRPPGRQPHV